MNKQLWFKIIKKAEKSGYKAHIAFLPLFPPMKMTKIKANSLLEAVLWNHRYELLFSHDLAKAIFGEKDMWAETKCTCGGVDFHMGGFDAHHTHCKRVKASRGYLFHLGKMVVEENPFDYLENYVYGTKKDIST